MKKTLSKWLEKVSEYTVTVFVIQAMLSGVGSTAVGVLVALSITALCLMWSLILADEEDADKEPGAAKTTDTAANGKNEGSKKSNQKKAQAKKARKRAKKYGKKTSKKR